MKVSSRLSLVAGGALALLMSSVLMAPISYAQAAGDTTQYFTLNEVGQATPTAGPPASSATNETVLKGGTPVSQTEIRNIVGKQKGKFKNFKDSRRTKFNAKKQKLCQQRQSKLAKNMQRSSSRSIRQADKFDRLVPRIESYVAKRNLTVPDYQVMMTVIAIKKVNVEASLQTLQTMKAEFKCDGETSNASVIAYKDALTTANSAIKEYRDAIKSLMTAAIATNKAKKAQAGAAGTTINPAAKPSLDEVEKVKLELDARGSSAPDSVTAWGVDPTEGLVAVRVKTSERTPEIDRFLEGINPNAIMLIYNSPPLKAL